MFGFRDWFLLGKVGVCMIILLLLVFGLLFWFGFKVGVFAIWLFRLLVVCLIDYVFVCFRFVLVGVC